MVHHWEHINSSLERMPKPNYHGKTFAQKMESLGLYTTNSGVKNGNRTGRSVTHIVMCKEEEFEEGPFSKVYDLLPDELLWPWKGKTESGNSLKPIPRVEKPIHRSRNKVKYECPRIHVTSEKGDRECDTTVWSKPDREGQLACMQHGDPVMLTPVNNPV